MSYHVVVSTDIGSPGITERPDRALHRLVLNKKVVCRRGVSANRCVNESASIAGENIAITV